MHKQNQFRLLLQFLILKKFNYSKMKDTFYVLASFEKLHFFQNFLPYTFVISSLGHPVYLQDGKKEQTPMADFIMSTTPHDPRSGKGRQGEQN